MKSFRKTSQTKITVEGESKAVDEPSDMSAIYNIDALHG